MKQNLSELIGTFALVFFGTGAIIVNDISGGTVTHTGIAVTFGLIVMAMIYSFGEISGAHINPAVTIAFWLSGRFSGKKVLPYIFFQLAGGLLASLMLKLLFTEHISLGATIPANTAEQSFVLEIILSFFLMLVIINVSTGSREIGTMAGIAVGSVVLLEALFAGPVSGASMNPARSFAPAVVSGNIQHLWIYLLAPVLGAALAILSCRIIKTKDCCPMPSIFCTPKQVVK